ncbi:MAG: MATE family efflux transporter [Chloroflexi bacterium]|nr:MATE family efflux transporter [Chloroflexota bacterium]
MRAAALKKDWTKGSVGANLWSLSWPIMITQSLTMIGPFVDQMWVGKLGAASVAGVGVSGMVVQVVNSITMGLFGGLRTMVARSIGAGDKEGANHVMQQAFVLGAGFSVFMAAVGLLFAEQALEVFGVAPDVASEGAAYMRIQLIGMVTMSLISITESAMQASGDAMNPMRINIFYRLIHVVFVPFFIFGWWVFPRLGVSGAALTNVIAQGMGGILGLWVLFGGHSRLQPTLKNFKLDWSIIWRMLKIGIPTSITGIQRSLPYVILLSFVAPFGTFAVAGYTVTRKISNFVQNPAASLGRSTGILAGQNLGAGQPERAERGGWLAVRFYTVAAIIVSIAVWFWAEQIVSIFNTEPGFIGVAATFLRIQIASYLLYGTVLVLSMCIEGSGDTMPIMLATLISMWAIQIPLGYLLPRFTNIGAYGAEWAIAGALFTRGIFFVIYFRSGRWKRKRI